MKINVIKQNMYCITPISDCVVKSKEGVILATVSVGKQKTVQAIDDEFIIEGEAIVTPLD